MSDYLQLKKANCRSCYKCIRNCPVKSIRFSDNQANIVSEECILCGRCFVVCPQNAKQIRQDVPAARQLLRGPDPVYASIAPSFVANFGQANIRSLDKALRRLGFAGVEETADGAAIVKKRFEQMTVEATQKVIISSCCHTVNLLIQKHYPAALSCLAPVISPMQAHGRDIKRRFPGARVVFIGPCIAKKAEAESYPGDIDCVLTFEDLAQWLNEEKIPLEPADDDSEPNRARLFPAAGGILRSMAGASPAYQYLAVDGLENCVHALEDIINGQLPPCFIEMSACAGSCIGGPCMGKNRRAPVRDFAAVNSYAGPRDQAVADYPAAALHKDLPVLASRTVRLGEAAISEVLRKLGKTRPEDELNCGSCGYNTCREKAAAVLQGKADLTMCLPFLKDKAESFSDNIIQNTPNAIIVLNENLEVQQINQAACRLARLRSPQDAVGGPVGRILDPAPFCEVLGDGKSIRGRLAYLAEYGKYVDQTVLYDPGYHIIIGILRDVTEEEQRRAEQARISQTAIEITDKVINRQMLAVQEIASLLGETTAETKIALSRLKESLVHE